MPMKKRFLTIRSQWRQQAETPLQAATRLAGLLLNLADAHPQLKRWFKKSLKKPSQVSVCQMPPDVSELETVLKNGAQFKDTVPPKPWPERGFQASAWNGALDGPTANFNLKIGAYDGKLAAFNRFEIILADLPVEGSLISPGVVRRIAIASSQKWSHRVSMWRLIIGSMPRHVIWTSRAPLAAGCRTSKTAKDVNSSHLRAQRLRP
jgi:hypothetical protein